MRIFKKVLIGLIIFISLTIFITIGYFWPIDSRLKGTFKSDKEATIKYLKTQKGFTDKQSYIVNQMYGHLTYIFKGHKIIRIMEPDTVEGSLVNDDMTMDESVEEKYYFIRESDEDSAMIVIMPSPWWDLNSTGIMEVEFDTDGFWVTAEILRSTGVRYKEKFNKEINE